MCRGFTGTNDGCHEALVLFQKATELETSFLRFSTTKPNFLPPLHISIIQYGCKNFHFLICRENFHFLMNWKHLFMRSSTTKPNFSPPVQISTIQYGCMPPNIFQVLVKTETIFHFQNIDDFFTIGKHYMGHFFR